MYYSIVQHKEVCSAKTLGQCHDRSHVCPIVCLEAKCILSWKDEANVLAEFERALE